ncbi:hypothetical protein RU639_005220 [Aspergillus parasiticus]
MATLMPSGYRSATEFLFHKEQTDAIIRTTAYHRKDYYLSVIWLLHREHNDIYTSIATFFQWTSSVGLGSLDRLPLELLFDTLCRLDMHSLFKFRQESPETQIRTLASVQKQLHMTKVESGQLRSLKSLPGIYSMNKSTTFDDVNRHRFYGDRVAKVKACHASYLCLLEQEATFEEGNNNHMESIC